MDGDRAVPVASDKTVDKVDLAVSGSAHKALLRCSHPGNGYRSATIREDP